MLIAVVRRPSKRLLPIIREVLAEKYDLPWRVQRLDDGGAIAADAGAVEPRRYLPLEQGLLWCRLERFGAKRPSSHASKSFASSSTGMRSW